jgi:hypothetical protein
MPIMNIQTRLTLQKILIFEDETIQLYSVSYQLSVGYYSLPAANCLLVRRPTRVSPWFKLSIP